MELAIEPQNSPLPLRGIPFVRGKSGNPGGRPKTSYLRKYAIRHLLKNVSNGVKQLDCAIDSTIETAIAGGSNGVAAMSFLRDTIDGRPSSSGDTGDSQTMAIQINIDTVGGQVQVKE